MDVTFARHGIRKKPVFIHLWSIAGFGDWIESAYALICSSPRHYLNWRSFMSRIVQSFLMGAMAACAFSFTAAAHADIPFGYTDSQDWDQRPYRHHNPAPRYENPYNDYQRMQRQSDYVRRQEENLSRDYHRDVQQFQQSRGYMRKHRR